VLGVKMIVDVGDKTKVILPSNAFEEKDEN
jgi:hypothetical protein